jgi:hypothetical protein
MIQLCSSPGGNVKVCGGDDGHDVIGTFVLVTP